MDQAHSLPLGSVDAAQRTAGLGCLIDHGPGHLAGVLHGLGSR